MTDPINNPFTIKPKDRKLLRSSTVRKWIKDVEKKLQDKMERDGTAWWANK